MNVIQNNSITFSAIPWLTDRGWTIVDNNNIRHEATNSGELVVTSHPIGQGNTYTYSFTVSNLTSGTLTLSIGGVVSDPITTNGYHEGTVTTTSSQPITFWSDANVQISGLDILMQVSETFVNDSETITWSEDRKGWITFKDMIPESGFSMYTNLFTFKEGNLWMHTLDGTTPNNFYGEQYSSKIKFAVGSVGVKTYHSVAIHGNKVLGTTEDGIETQLGQVSDLVSFDFKTREGIHYANLLRDKLTNDKLKGRYIVVELTDEESPNTLLQIFKVVIKSNISTVNE